MSAYGQFCPAFKAMELLGERWTMLVVRELLLDSRHFNELRPIVDALGAWGVRWIPELGEEDLGWPEGLRSGRIEVHGPAWVRGAAPRRFGQSPLAAVPRPAAVS